MPAVDIEVKSLPKQLLTGCFVAGWLLGGCGRAPIGTDSPGGDIRRDATVEAIEKVLSKEILRGKLRLPFGRLGLRDTFQKLDEDVDGD